MKILLFVFLGVIILALIVFFAWNHWRTKNMIQENPLAQKIDYIIPGVPYYGIYNHKESASFLSTDKPAAIASVLEYWNPGKNNFQTIDQFFPNLVERKEFDKPRSWDEIKNFVNSQGNYVTEIEELIIDDLKKYVNPKTKTPVIITLAIDQNQPVNIPYYTMKVLIGIKESEQKLVFHDFWFGNNYELTYDEFNKLAEKTNPRFKNKYLVIQPKDINNKLKEINNASNTNSLDPKRTQLTNINSQMLLNYILGSAVLKYGLPSRMAIDYSEKVKNEASFESSFPPIFKTLLFFRLAQAYLALDDLDNALAAALKSVELNHDLDKPSGDWPGYEIAYNSASNKGQLSNSYRILGDVFNKRGAPEEAKYNYQKALEIYPENQLAQEGLQSIAEK